MPPIDAIVAIVWAVFLVLITLVLSYFGFVVARRQDREVEPATEDAATAYGAEA